MVHVSKIHEMKIHRIVSKSGVVGEWLILTVKYQTPQIPTKTFKISLFSFDKLIYV